MLFSFIYKRYTIYNIQHTNAWHIITIILVKTKGGSTLSQKVLMKGNEAIGEAAIRAGVKAYYGYPITPQTELTAYMGTHMPEKNRIFIQTESEICAINAVYGSASAGFRAMTSSAGTAMSLKQEGIAMMAYMEVPGLIVDMMRGGPGLGNIIATQGEYNQATKCGGNGDYHVIVVAPNSVQECVDLTRTALELADKYRNPALLLADGTIGQMMEVVEFPEPIEPEDIPCPEWALTGAKGGKIHKIEPRNSADDLEGHNIHLQQKYAECEANEKRSESIMTEDCEVLIVAFGFVSRIAHGVVEELREEGIKAGLFRPITLWPYDDANLIKAAEKAKFVVVLEGNAGMMCRDVRLFLGKDKPVLLNGRMGGNNVNGEDVKEKIKQVIESGNYDEWREYDGKQGVWKTFLY